MVLTPAERKARYIEKQKLFNNDEYKLKQKIKNKKYYASKFKHTELTDEELIPPNENITTEFVYLEPIKKRINPINKSKLNMNTIHIYTKTMKKFYFDFHKVELINDIDLINLLSNKPYNIDNINSQFGFIKKNIYDFIKNYNKDDLRILYSVITRIKYFSVPVKQLYPYILNFQNIYNSNRANKIIDNSVISKLKSLSFDKNDILDKFNNSTNISTNEKLIFVLLTLFPTRRPVDYRKMLITFNEPPNQSKLNYNDKFNFYYNKSFYFNITKNKKIQKFTVPDELDTIIKSLTSNKKNNDFILSINNKQFTQIQLSKLIMNTFFKLYDVSISAVEIRRLYATHLKYLVDNNMLSEKEHRDISEMMNHNYEENKKYSYS